MLLERKIIKIGKEEFNFNIVSLGDAKFITYACMSYPCDYFIRVDNIKRIADSCAIFS